MLNPDSKFSKWGLFIFAAFGGLGGLACILQWADIKPGDLRMIPTFPHVAWLVFGLILFAASLFTSIWALRRNLAISKAPSKLQIYSANYAAEDGGGKKYEVDEYLRKITTGDSLVLDVENHNFALPEKNYVELDPRPGSRKRLQVTYSYDGGRPETVERLEHYRMVLPEDTYVNDSFTKLMMQLAPEDVESNKEWQAEAAEQKRLSIVGSSVDGLFNPSQIKSLRIRKDLTTLLTNMGQMPEPGTQAFYSWHIQLKAEYEIAIAPRVKDLCLDLKRKGINPNVPSFYEEGINEYDDIPELMQILLGLSTREDLR